MIVISVLALPSLLAPAQALGADSDLELRRVIEDQQQQINELRQQVNELRRLLQGQGKQIDSRAKDAKKKEGPASVGMPSAESAAISTTVPSSGKAPLSQIEKHDRKHPTGSNFRVSDHTGTIPIPSIGTEIGVHGFVEMQILHDTNGIDDNEFDTVRIPVDGSPSQTKFNRSNLVFGYVNAYNPDFVDEDQLDSTMYIALNLVWNPFKAVTFGAEWLWGKRENRDCASGIDNRFLVSSKFDF